jgi:hypothetical protein
MDSAKHLLATVLLGRPVADYIADARTAGTSWRRIEQAIRRDTDGQVDVTAETLRKWAKA